MTYDPSTYSLLWFECSEVILVVTDRKPVVCGRCTAATLPGMWDRTVTIGSAGKTFSMTGCKLGWSIGPKHLVFCLSMVHQNCVALCPTQLQVTRAFILAFCYLACAHNKELYVVTIIDRSIRCWPETNVVAINNYICCMQLLLRPGRGAEYYDQPVCLSVCVSVCRRAYLWNRWTDLHELFCADFLGPWLGPPLAALRYVMYFRFYGKSVTLPIARHAPRHPIIWNSCQHYNVDNVRPYS